MAFESIGVEYVFIVAILVGAVAFFYSNLGLGGGQLYVPIMVVFFTSLHMREIVPLSLCFAFVTMLSAAYTHSRKGLVDFRLGSMLAAGGLVGVLAGVMFTSSVEDRIAKLGFVVLLLIVATKMMYDLYKAKKENLVCPADFSLKCRLAGVGVSILTGFLIGSFGIGGGVVSVPLIIYVFRFETRKAIGTSAFMGAILTPAAFVAYAFQEGVSINYDLVLVLTPLVFVMGLIGSTWGLKKLRTKVVRAIFTGGVYLAACVMIYNLFLQ